jgi:hypothetical protein
MKIPRHHSPLPTLAACFGLLGIIPAAESLDRTILPIPDRTYDGPVYEDAKDPRATFAPIEPLRPPAGAPNVLVILFDDVGFSDFGCYGSAIRTPFIDALAGRGLPVKPVLWVGRRHVVLAGRADAAEMAPIRIKAGALGPNTPKRDLVVSPDHCLYLDGALVPARLLVNGRSVVAEIGMAEVTWYHVELETHEVLVAEGASAESWLDCGNRSWFQNAPVAMLTVPGNLDTVGTGWDASRACAPLVHGGERLAAIRASLDTRAEALAAPQPARMAR